MANRYWVGNSGSTTDTAHWSVSSGGAGGASVPAAADAAIFDANSFTLTGQTVTANGNISTYFQVKSMDWTGVLNSPTLASGTAISILCENGSLILSPDMTITYTGGFDVATEGPSIVFDLGGHTLPDASPFLYQTPGPAIVTLFAENGGVIDVLNDINIANRCLRFSGGAVDVNGYNINAGSLELICSSLTEDTEVDFGSPDITLVGQPFSIDGPYTTTGIISIIQFNPSCRNVVMSGNFPITIAYNGDFTIYSDGNNPDAYLCDVTITDGTSVTFDFDNTPIGNVLIDVLPLTINFKSGTTTSTDSFTANGNFVNGITIRSTTPGSTAILEAGTSSVSYIDVKDNIAMGDIPFDDSLGGTDSGNNTNWFFGTAGDEYLQTTFFVGADPDGDVQMINIGKSDDGTPIYFELNTQELEFGNRGHLKKVADNIVIFVRDGIDSQIKVRENDNDYKEVPIDLNNRVNIGEDINLSGYFLTFKWFGETSTSSPVLEGIYLEHITDEGITYG